MQFLKKELLRVVPLCFMAGSSIELFMCKTGFYEIVTKKEGERRAEREWLEKQRLERMKELRVKIEDARSK